MEAVLYFEIYVTKRHRNVVRTLLCDPRRNKRLVGFTLRGRHKVGSH
jgi:hypothetical protein